MEALERQNEPVIADEEGDAPLLDPIEEKEALSWGLVYRLSVIATALTQIEDNRGTPLDHTRQTLYRSIALVNGHGFKNDKKRSDLTSALLLRQLELRSTDKDLAPLQAVEDHLERHRRNTQVEGGAIPLTEEFRTDLEQMTSWLAEMNIAAILEERSQARRIPTGRNSLN